jgi:hypothetical protein
MPLDVPMTIDVDTARQVGRPKLRFPISENACPVIFRNFVHRTTSQGPWSGSVSVSGVGETWLVIEDCRECRCAKNGEPDLDTLCGEDDSRDWKRRSNGRRAGLGLTSGDPRRARALLLKEDGTEPYN